MLNSYVKFIFQNTGVLQSSEENQVRYIGWLIPRTDKASFSSVEVKLRDNEDKVCLQGTLLRSNNNRTGKCTCNLCHKIWFNALKAVAVSSPVI